MKLHPNVWLLMLAQAFIGSTGPLIVFVGGFIGMQLAPSPALATMPVAFMVIGIAIFTLPIVRMLSIVGRKKGFLLAISAGVLNTFFCAYAVTIQHFWLFCCSIILFGIPLSTVQQFRFAAMESVSPNKAGQAVSVLLLAGLAAAFIGPELGLAGKDLFAIEFVGSFILLATCLVVALLILLFITPTDSSQTNTSGQARSLGVIMRQPVFILSLSSAAVGFAVMSFIMTATPISMHVHHHFSMEQTKWVIQSHIIAMYLPSLLTGIVVKKFGPLRLLITGILALVICIVVGYINQTYSHFWFSLVILGIGWNFMFVAATSLLPQSYRENEKFKVQGINDFTIFSVQAVVSLSAGWVMQEAGWNILLLLNIPLIILVLSSIYYWQRSQQHVVPPTPSAL
ncbi:MFS transporter [Neptunicella sp. SCSIO 80796]|uniref:MFS transporter n=1 Tax=Neptunicella plasticusilytica TaxID=3117012 RepID=UPI003A4D32B7